MSFAADKRLDVIITIMKTVQCCFVYFRYAQGGGPIFRERNERNYTPPSKLWRRPCQGETVKVKFVYNRLTGEKGVAK